MKVSEGGSRISLNDPVEANSAAVSPALTLERHYWGLRSECFCALC